MSSPGTVLVIGGANLDLAFRSERVPEAGETVDGAKFSEGLGGKGANQAVAAVRCAASVRFVGAVGEDRAGEQLLGAVSAEGVDTRACLRAADQPTGRASIWVDGCGENRILVAPGANASLTAERVARALERTADVSVVLCQLETPVAGVSAALAWGRRAGARGILNGAPVLPLSELGSLPDILIVNEHEARMLAGKGSGAEPGPLAADLGDRHRLEAVVVTTGAAGACLWHRGRSLSIPSPEVRVVDTTGAGDAFCGGFAARLAAGDELPAAVRFACAAGALATLGEGALDSMPRAAEVLALLNREPASP